MYKLGLLIPVSSAIFVIPIAFAICPIAFITSALLPSSSFSYKDYRDGANTKTATISGVEFLRRFAGHLLPNGFMRIRHYGFLAGRNKPTELNLAKAELGQKAWEKLKISWQQISEEKLGIKTSICPSCKTPTMVCVATQMAPRAPPMKIQAKR